MQGPNVKKLIVRRISMLAVPDGGGCADAIGWLTSPDSVSKTVREATEWVKEAIGVVKTAPDNSFGDDDEAIAGEILRQIEEKQKPALAPNP